MLAASLVGIFLIPILYGVVQGGRESVQGRLLFAAGQAGHGETGDRRFGLTRRGSRRTAESCLCRGWRHLTRVRHRHGMAEDAWAREGRRRARVRACLVALLGLGLALPALALWLDALRQSLGPDPWAEASQRSGSWALVFLLASLTVTPLRQTLRLAALAPMRRVIGLTAFAYAVLHLGIHLGSIGGDVRRFLAELLSQRNLLFGALAIALLIPLAATSFDRAIRALGGVAWRRLHLLVFPAAGLAIVHFAVSWPQKVDVTEPAVAAGLFAWLVGYRLIAPRGGAPGPATYAGLALAASAVTAGLEFAWFALRTRVDPWLVLAANLDPDLAPRPAAWVLAAGVAALVLRLARPPASSARRGRLARQLPIA